MAKQKTRRSFTKEFKLDVIAQSYQRDNIRGLADELGLRPELIYRWRSEYGRSPQQSFPGKGNPSLSPEAQELTRLQRENSDLRLERDILKKAIGIYTFIELWHNRKRLHSALDYRTPAQTEQLLTQNQAA